MTTIVLGTRNTSRWPEGAGSTWVRLQYMLGLRKLGFETFWVDRLGGIDPYSHPHTIEYLAKRFDSMARDFGFQDHYCIVYNDGERFLGMSERDLTAVAKGAEILINVSGHLEQRSPLAAIPRRAYIDVDPGFTQIWAHQWDMGLSQHNYFFTTGQTVGGPGFTIPLRGIEWHAILPPVVLDEWPAHIDERAPHFTTVADWRASQVAEFEGRRFGTKRKEFLRFLRLPMETSQSVELALLISLREHEDLRLLVENNWKLRDPMEYAGDPHSYREYIQRSRGEFSVAKHGYVASNSGWVSDRTVCYLASGKPALVESTGFEPILPTGEGLLTFSTLQEAVAGFQRINEDYLLHCQAARKLAETHFDSNKTLSYILDRMSV